MERQDVDRAHAYLKAVEASGRWKHGIKRILPVWGRFYVEVFGSPLPQPW